MTKDYGLVSWKEFMVLVLIIVIFNGLIGVGVLTLKSMGLIQEHTEHGKPEQTRNP